MATTKYSHAFLVGSFNRPLGPQEISNAGWKAEIIHADGNDRYRNDRGYNGLCTLFYKAHIDAMLESDSELQINRPDFLKDVHHYYYDVPKEQQIVNFNKIKEDIDYQLRICKLHIFTFPLDISLFSIEIDDTGQELEAITMGHFVLARWAWGWDRNFMPLKEQLSQTLEPLRKLLPSQDLKNLISGGNKLKIFQTFKLDIDEPDDKMLYEIASCSSIGCIDDKTDRNSPATTYWKSIVDNNSVSTFRNWKALALVDTFTMMGNENSFDEDDCNFLYFPLIYIRCVFEKNFCFSRNTLYREDRADRKLSDQIGLMEQYYFYDNISHNFQPNLLYQAMAKGLGIKEEREELSKQIKEKAKKDKEDKKEREEKRFDNILAGVSIFAVISVIWDFCSIVKDASGVDSNTSVPTYARIFIAVGFVLIVFLWYIIYRKKDGQ